MRVSRSVVLGVLCLASAQVFAQGTLERIAERGEFRIGYRTDARPLSFEEVGLPAGYSVDICRHIAAEVRAHLSLPDLRISYVPVTLENRFDAIVDGRIDIECGSTTMTLERMERVDFTLMTYVTGGSLLSMAADPVNSPQDLGGRRVAVIRGTSTDAGLQAYLSENDIDTDVVAVANSSAGMAALLGGDVEAFASDQVILVGDALSAMERDPDVDFHFTTELFSYEPYALMVRRDDADFRLLANRAIARLFRSGDFGPIYDNWIGSYGIAPPNLLIAIYQLQALPE